MHQYLNAIGFGKLKDYSTFNMILKDIEESYDGYDHVSLDGRNDFGEYYKEFAPGVGIAVCGTIDEYDSFTREYSYPYFIGTGVTSHADTFVEKRIDREDYVGICEDAKVGINLMFTLQNKAAFLREKRLGSKEFLSSSVTLSALSEKAVILLPVQKSEEQERKQKEASINRMMLLSAAKTGDQTALENLTLDDIDTYSKVSRRLVSEDIFTIVDTYIMPYGIDCDRYSILGEIIELNEVENDYTLEHLFLIKLNVNELMFDVCIPKNGLIGEPAVGRRFKGIIWMQGRINL